MSTSSLYGSTGNVVVSSNNVTTLYNATGGNIVTANVPDRDFTTLYTQQTDVRPTYPYGNANVEAFLNVGNDAGGNVVQNINANGNIHANGNLTISGITNLGPASNVHITGGNLNYVLQTDGTGNLSWTALTNEGANGAPYIHFDVVATSNNQTFSNVELAVYNSNSEMSVFKNGVNIEPSLYTISGNILTINILLNTGDTIDVLPSATGTGSMPGGNLTEIQYNGGTTLSGNASFTFDQPNSKMTVGQISTGNITGSNTSISSLTVSGVTSLGSASNVHITGGGAGQFLSTNGNGNLSWSSTVVTSINTGVANVHIGGGTNGQVLSTDGSNNLSWTSFIANSNFANTSESSNTSEYSNIANSATIATSATTAGSANTASTVTVAAQPNITSVGTLTTFSSTGTIDFTGASNVALGSNTIVHIGGGTAGQYLSTDGTGNLSWANVGTTTAAGTNTQVQFNNGGILGGNSGFTFNKVTGLFNAPNLSASTGNFTTINSTAIITSTVAGNLNYSYNLYSYNNAPVIGAGNITVNLASKTTTFDPGYSLTSNANIVITTGTLLPSAGRAIDGTIYIKVGATPYVITNLYLNGNIVTPLYVDGINPTSVTLLANAVQSYSYSILATGSNTYTVIGTFTQHKA